MTNSQLYLSIGIPSALFALNFLGILGAAFWQTKRFDDFKDVFKAELGRVEGVLTAKLDGLSTRVKALEDEMHSPIVKR